MPRKIDRGSTGSWHFTLGCCDRAGVLHHSTPGGSGGGAGGGSGGGAFPGYRPCVSMI